MTKRELSRVAKALAERVPELVSDRNLVFVPPTEHTVRGVLLEGSIVPRAFYANVFCQPLFVPNQRYHVLNLGWRLGGGAHFWNADSSQSIEELTAAVSRNALPFLKGIESPVDVVSAVRSLRKEADFYVQQTLAFGLAKIGSVIEAVDRLDKLAGKLSQDDGWQGTLRRNCEMLRDLLVTSPGDAQALLRRWEAENAIFLRPKAEANVMKP